MGKVVIITYATYSHHTGIVPIIKSLLNKNIEVYVFGRKEYEYLYKDMKVEFISYIDNDIQYEINKKMIAKKEECNNKLAFDNSYNNVVEYFVNSLKLEVDLEINNYENNIDKIKEINPDLIIKDACCFYGSIIGEELGIRTIGYVCNLAYVKEFLLTNPKKYLADALKMDFSRFDNESLINMYEEVEGLLNDHYKHKNLPKINLLFNTESNEDTILVFSCNKLQPKLENRAYKVVRYDLFNTKNIILKKSKLIYISTGTVIANDIYFYLNVIEAFRGSDFNVIISTVNADDLKRKIKLSKNIVVEKFVDQKEILSEASLFITHGGYNSICEAIYYEVPTMIYPLGGDNFFNASLAHDIGIGVDLRKIKFNPETIYKLSDFIINNNDIKDNIKMVKEDFYNTKNLEDIINEVING